MKITSTAWAIIAISVLAGAILVWASTARSPEPVLEFPPVSVDDHIKGAATSTVVLVEYLDFECEACGAYYPVVKQLEEEYGDRVTFVARYYPIQSHRNALPAAYAAEAASRQGKFWEMHDLLFTRQKEWGEKQVATPEIFEGFAQELGLNMEQFKADVASPEVVARVKRDQDAGNQLGVKSTPTFFLNGKRIQNPQGYEAFKALLDAELK